MPAGFSDLGFSDHFGFSDHKIWVFGQPIYKKHLGFSDGESLFSFLPPSKSLISVSNPRRAFWADTASLEGTLPIDFGTIERYNDTVRYGELSIEVLGQHQYQLTRTLIVCVFSIGVKKPTWFNWSNSWRCPDPFITPSERPNWAGHELWTLWNLSSIRTFGLSPWTRQFDIWAFKKHVPPSNNCIFAGECGASIRLLLQLGIIDIQIMTLCWLFPMTSKLAGLDLEP